MAWSPGENGTATSISVFSKYARLLLKRRPPRDMSSHATISSAEPARRTQALKFTRVRACFRRLSRSFTARRAPDTAALGAATVGVSAGSVAGKMPALRSTKALGAIGSIMVAGAIGSSASACIHAGPANEDGRCVTPAGPADFSAALEKRLVVGSKELSSVDWSPDAAFFHNVDN